MEQKRILLIITGSVAAHKAIDLANILNNNSYKLQILLTKAAKEFVKPNPIAQHIEFINDDLFDWEQEEKFGHINLSRRNDLIIIYPATADLMARIAQGRANDLATAIILASNKKIFIAPAMNVEMWHKKITQDNIAKLQSLGMDVIAPNKGKLACGEEGEGRAKEPEEMLAIIEEYFSYAQKLAGKKILITAGATIEKIDPVRYISNFSSGKQAIAIAKKSLAYGAEVMLIKGRVSCSMPQNLDIIEVDSAQEMYDAVANEIKNHSYDAAFMVAAVADYKVKEEKYDKIKKAQTDNLTLELVKNPDILKFIAEEHYNRPKLVIGFAAESKNLLEHAKTKLKNKACDYIVANNIKDNDIFDSEYNHITLLDQNEAIASYQGSKDQVAEFLLQQLF